MAQRLQRYQSVQEAQIIEIAQSVPAYTEFNSILKVLSFKFKGPLGTILLSWCGQ